MMQRTTLHKVAAYGTIATTLVTIFTCVVISSATDSWYGGLTVPYISDTGREKPETYLFAIGMSTAALLAGVVATTEASYLRAHLGALKLPADSGKLPVRFGWLGASPVVLSRMATVAWINHLLAVPFGIIVGTVSTRVSIGLHVLGAAGFFLFTMIATVLNTIVVGQALSGGAVWLSLSFKLKRVLVSMACVTVILYQGVGRVVACDAPDNDGVYDYRESRIGLPFLTIVATYALDIFDAALHRSPSVSDGEAALADAHHAGSGSDSGSDSGSGSGSPTVTGTDTGTGSASRSTAS
ncbi:uncharacterized protein AMSG_03964 [Thecamonas trahens ATCC 50062]|uniref:CWH43-like N-terminal domain-containing protein n=1 Tax=Thecamonas trahens ATCC 50062 TaxID=461836 RepID=A0A0L0D5T6_THETB|nr:hypothetical protein AMSG_03964 [Thecamonas trahens ATCC 50062]KNC47737.1 hypothetical protein AMSG_03964 [Thecamonas trahens ATCC 50062]|eukprot:XP_013759215.1 hypothetical protein AMSG_03964 [Thecamonas trahens ATCC 50062]